MCNIKYLFLFLPFISLISFSNTMKGNEVVLVHKDDTIIEKNLFDKLFTTPAEAEVEFGPEEEETIILSSRNKRPIPNIERPIVDLSGVVEYNSRKPKENVKCAHYKRGTDLDVDRMMDEWQVVYYKLPHNITCFKIHIKMNTYEEKKHHYDLYGNLSNEIDWNLCNIEIKGSGENEMPDRKHFLHGTFNNKGVMDNVVIAEVTDIHGKLKPTLIDESPDQWLVVKNLLLMRDCRSGGIVVFTRSSDIPRREDILDALMVFGEEKADGKMGCYYNLQYNNSLKSQLRFR